MSLRRCPDCAREVSSAARACPHCGRPGNRSVFSIELAAALAVAVACIGALSWHSSWQGESANGSVVVPAPPETIIARPYRPLAQTLTAVISYNRRLNLFRVENRDSFPWMNCQMSLNSHGISGYELTLTAINPGLTDAALLQAADFVDADGRNFDPSATGVATLDLDCESPGGHLYYGGRFAPQDPTGSLALR